VWQWNHNPDSKHWSLSARPGYLRLTTGRVDTSFLLARNTLTQRTIGPQCIAETCIDVTRMKEGDFAGLALLQSKYGQVGVRKDHNGKKHIVMVTAESGRPVEIESVPVAKNTIYLKAHCDFTERKDIANFFYSVDGRNWMPIGSTLRMSYTIPHFMGYRYALFNYASKHTGGIVDFDFFRINTVK